MHWILHINTRPFIGIMAWTACILLSGCKSPQNITEETDHLIWPPPPATGKIAYVKSISNPTDLGFRKNWFKSVSNFIIGNSWTEPAFIKPTGICISKQGTLCITDMGNSTVWYFDLKQNRSKQWSHIDDKAFSAPVAVAIHENRIYIADSGRGEIIVFSTKGKPLFTVSEHLERPSSLAIDGETLWVTDSRLHQIIAFDLDGRFKEKLGNRGTAEGMFNFPTHIAVEDGHQGALLVTDSLNFRIQKIDQQGVPMQIIGALGNVSGSFSRPKGVATDREGNVYVVDSLFANIQIFDSQGRFLMHWGENGTAPGSFWLPTGIAIDASDQIWVADSYNRRIQVYKRVNHHD